MRKNEQECEIIRGNKLNEEVNSPLEGHEKWMKKALCQRQCLKKSGKLTQYVKLQESLPFFISTVTWCTRPPHPRPSPVYELPTGLCADPMPPLPCLITMCLPSAGARCSML